MVVIQHLRKTKRISIQKIHSQTFQHTYWNERSNLGNLFYIPNNITTPLFELYQKEKF